LTLRESSPDMMSAAMSVSAVRVPSYKKWTSVFMQFWVLIKIHCTQIVWKLYKQWMSVFTHSSGYALEYMISRLCQKCTCSEWLYASGYPLKCIAPLFPVAARNLHSGLLMYCYWWPFQLIRYWYSIQPLCEQWQHFSSPAVCLSAREQLHWDHTDSMWERNAE